MDKSVGSSERRKRRIRSPHPGVKLKPPSEAKRMSYWRAVYRDPDTGKDVYERLDPSAFSTERARADWAKRKAREIAKREQELEDGAPRTTGLTFKDCIDKYYRSSAELRPNTVRDYKVATTAFQRWAAANSVSPDSLTRAHLIEYKAWCYSLDRYAAASGEKRGTKAATGKRRSAATVNGELRVMRRVLGWLRATDRLPRCSTEDLKIALSKYREEQSPPRFLTPAQLHKLFEAAERHDRHMFALTRFEKKAGTAGSTPRHPPIAPLVAGILLTGMRLDEACLIDWSTHVHLDAMDYDGQEVGEIKLRAQDTKTHRARSVVFDVSALLRLLFQALYRRSNGKGSVFGVTYDEARSALKRLRHEYGAPSTFDWQTLRSTCSSYLTNAPAIYGAAAPFRAAKQLGHSVKVAESNYAGLVRGIPHTAKTLEAAMQIEADVSAVVDRLKGYLKQDNVVRLAR